MKKKMSEIAGGYQNQNACKRHATSQGTAQFSSEKIRDRTGRYLHSQRIDVEYALQQSDLRQAHSLEGHIDHPQTTRQPEVH